MNAKELKPRQIEMKVNFKGDKSKLFKINSSAEAYEVLKEIFNSDTIDWTEEAILLCLNTQHKVIGYYKLSSGGLTGVIMDNRVIFQIALLSNATRIIVAHNHPTGNLTPSESDNQITESIKKAGEILNIPLLDHLIVTSENYYSYADSGKL